MSTPTLKVGSFGPAVRELQALLNSQLTPSPKLVPDGQFGALTAAAVRRFQASKWLVQDGEAGECTMNALRGSEDFIESVSCHLVPQPTPTTCWAASTAMVLGKTVPASAPPGIPTKDGVPNDSDLSDFPTTTAYNRAFGLTLLAPMSWLPSGLAHLIRAHGRLLVNTLWDARGYNTPTAPGHYIGSGGHYRVFAGLRGNDRCATVRIYDPWPPNRGAVYSASYARLVQDVLTTTYQISYR